MNVKMYSAAREATTRARNVASAIQQVQRQVNDDNKDVAGKVDKDEQIRGKRKAELELAAADNAKKLAAKQATLTGIQATIGLLQSVLTFAVAVTKQVVKTIENEKKRGEESGKKKETDNKPATTDPTNTDPVSVTGGTQADIPKPAEHEDEDDVALGAGEPEPEVEDPQDPENPQNTTVKTGGTDDPQEAAETGQAVEGDQTDETGGPGGKPTVQGQPEEGGAEETGGPGGTGRPGGTGGTEQTGGTEEGGGTNPTATTDGEQAAEGAEGAGKKDEPKALFAKVSFSSSNGGDGVFADRLSNKIKNEKGGKSSLGDDIALLILKLIELLKKASGISEQNSLFDGIVGGVSKIGKLLVTGQGEIDPKTGKPKELSLLGKGLSALTKPVAEAAKLAVDAVAAAAIFVGKAAVVGATAVAGAASSAILTATAPLTGIDPAETWKAYGETVSRTAKGAFGNGQGGGVEGTTGESDVSADTNQALADGNFSSEDRAAFEQNATKALKAQGLSDEEIATRVGSAADAIENDVASGALSSAGIQGVQTSKEGKLILGGTADDQGNITGGLELGRDVVQAIAGGGEAAQKALGLVGQAASLGGLLGGGGPAGSQGVLDISGTIKQGTAIIGNVADLANSALQTAGSIAGNIPLVGDAVENATKQVGNLAEGIVDAAVDLTNQVGEVAQSLSEGDIGGAVQKTTKLAKGAIDKANGLIQQSVGAADSILSGSQVTGLDAGSVVKGANGATAKVGGQDVSLSGADLRQIEVAKAAGLNVTVGVGEGGKASLSFATAEGGAVTGDQVKQLTGLANTGAGLSFAASGAEGAVSFGVTAADGSSVSLNGNALEGLAGTANSIANLVNAGATIGGLAGGDATNLKVGVNGSEGLGLAQVGELGDLAANLAEGALAGATIATTGTGSGTTPGQVTVNGAAVGLAAVAQLTAGAVLGAAGVTGAQIQNDGSVKGQVGGTDVTLSADQVKQISAANAAGLTTTVGSDGKVSFATADGGEVTGAQVDQIAKLQAAGVNIAGISGTTGNVQIQLGGASGNAALSLAQAGELAGLAGKVSAGGLSGVAITAGTDGLSIGGQKLSDVIKNVDTARAVLGASAIIGVSSFGTASQTVDGVKSQPGSAAEAASQQATLNSLAGLKAAGVDLNYTGAKLEGGGLRLADGRKVTAKDGGGLTIASSDGNSSLTITAGTLRALSGQANVDPLDKGRLANAIKAGLTLTQNGAIGAGNATVGYEAGHGNNNVSLTINDSLGGDGTRVDLNTVEAISKGNVTAEQLEGAGIKGQSAGLAILAARGVSLQGASVDAGGNVTLKNGAKIDAGLITNLTNGSLSVDGTAARTAATALGKIFAGQGDKNFSNISVSATGEIKAGNVNLNQIQVSQIANGGSGSGALIENARVAGRGSPAPTSALLKSGETALANNLNTATGNAVKRGDFQAALKEGKTGEATNILAAEIKKAQPNLSDEQAQELAGKLLSPGSKARVLGAALLSNEIHTRIANDKPGVSRDEAEGILNESLARFGIEGGDANEVAKELIDSVADTDGLIAADPALAAQVQSSTTGSLAALAPAAVKNAAITNHALNILAGGDAVTGAGADAATRSAVGTQTTAGNKSDVDLLHQRIVDRAHNLGDSFLDIGKTFADIGTDIGRGFAGIVNWFANLFGKGDVFDLDKSRTNDVSGSVKQEAVRGLSEKLNGEIGGQVENINGVVSDFNSANQIVNTAQTAVNAANGADGRPEDAGKAIEDATDKLKKLGYSDAQISQLLGVTTADGKTTLNVDRSVIADKTKSDLVSKGGFTAEQADAIVNGPDSEGNISLNGEALASNLTSRLQALGFEGSADDPASEIGQILKVNTDDDDNVTSLGFDSGNLRDALNEHIQVSRTSSDGATTFSATLNGQSLGSVNIAADGTLSAQGEGELEGSGRFGGIVDEIQQSRKEEIAKGINEVVGDNSSHLSVSARDIELDDAGNIKSIRVGDRKLSVEDYAKELQGSTSAQGVLSAQNDARRRNPLLGGPLTLDAARINGIGEEVKNKSLGVIKTGGESGVNAAVQSTLNNLKAVGVNVDAATVTVDKDGNATVNVPGREGGEAQSFQINADGSLKTDEDLTPEERDAAEKALVSGLVQTTGTKTADGTSRAYTADEAGGQADKFSKNQKQIQDLRNDINGSFSKSFLPSLGAGFVGSAILSLILPIFGLAAVAFWAGTALAGGTGADQIGPKVKNLDVQYDADGNIRGAKVGLNDDSSFDVGINEDTGTFAVKNVDGNHETGAGKLLENLRSRNLQRRLEDAGAGDISISQTNNVGQVRASDHNNRNDDFAQEGRLSFTLADATDPTKKVSFDVGVAFDSNGNAHVNLEGLDEDQIAAIKNAVSPNDPTISDQAALRIFGNKLGSSGVGADSIRGDDGHILSNSELSPAQRESRDRYATEIKNSEGAIIHAATRAGGANVRFASLEVRALLGEDEALGLIGHQAAGSGQTGTVKDRSDKFREALANGDKAGAQKYLDQALVASGLQAGSISVDELLTSDGNGGQRSLTGAEAIEKLGGVSVQAGYDGRSATITGSNVSFVNQTALQEIYSGGGNLDEGVVEGLFAGKTSALAGDLDTVRNSDAYKNGNTAERNQLIIDTLDEHGITATASDAADIREGFKDGTSSEDLAAYAFSGKVIEVTRQLDTAVNQPVTNLSNDLRVLRRSEGYKKAVAENDVGEQERLLREAVGKNYDPSTVNISQLNKDLKAGSPDFNGLASGVARTGTLSTTAQATRSAAVQGILQDNNLGSNVNFTVEQNHDGTRSVSVEPNSQNADGFSEGLNHELPDNKRGVGSSIAKWGGESIKWLAAGLEAALPGLMAFKKAMEELQEIHARLEAAEKQFAAALEYAQKMGVTNGQSNTGGSIGDAAGTVDAGSATGPNTSVQTSTQIAVSQNAPKAGASLQTKDGSPAKEPGSPSQIQDSPKEAQQDAQSELLQQVAGDANFANVAVLLGMNPGMLIEQAQQVEMLDKLSQTITQLQSPFGNPVQEMQRFVESLKAKSNEFIMPQDGIQSPF
ncbi:MAG: beta strand repeat-containing protein [Candidatus Sericytochromatia bacterium]